ncbi:MAG: arginase family protein [Bdellovibrionaceae bacterium]|nr:arginase family protein [Pseudobdellovibrionaceae bacterium]MDW8190203.1 arginase family protein [Pseudobdellovibrionaceae bacterium]
MIEDFYRSKSFDPLDLRLGDFAFDWSKRDGSRLLGNADFAGDSIPYDAPTGLWSLKELHERLNSFGCSSRWYQWLSSDASVGLSRNELFNKIAYPLVLGGFPTHQGVLANGGRGGSGMAPDSIRRFLYLLTPDPRRSYVPHIMDWGNAPIAGICDPNVVDQEALKWCSQLVRGQGQFGGTSIILGGGHELGYSTLLPFLERQDEDSCLIVHVDAHLDVRPFDRIVHSGNPFFRLFHMNPKWATRTLAWGIQPYSCSDHHYRWLTQRGTRVIFRDEIEGFWGDPWWNNGIKDGKPWDIYLSVDVDVFSQAVAPGCSAPQGLGVELTEFFQLLSLLKKRGRLKWLGFFEGSPPLDLPHLPTQRLIAQLILKIVDVFF